VVLYRAAGGGIQKDERFVPPFSMKLWRQNMDEEPEAVIHAKEQYYLRQFERNNLEVLLRNQFPMSGNFQGETGK
jgi:hypothetical protein